MAIAPQQFSGDVARAERVSERLQRWLWENAEETRVLIATRADCSEVFLSEILADPELTVAWLSRQRDDVGALHTALQLGHSRVNEALCRQSSLPVGIATELATTAHGEAAWALLARLDLDTRMRARLAIESVRQKFPSMTLSADKLADRVGTDPDVWVAILGKGSDPVFLAAALQACPDAPAVHRAVVDAIGADEQVNGDRDIRIKPFTAQYPDDSRQGVARRAVNTLLSSASIPLRELHRLQGLRAASPHLKAIQIRISWQSALESASFTCRYDAPHIVDHTHATLLDELAGERRLTQLFAAQLVEEVCAHLDDIDPATIGVVLSASGYDTIDRLTRVALRNGDSAVLAALGRHTTLGVLDAVTDDFPLPPLLDAVPVSVLPAGFVARYAQRIVKAAPLVAPLLGVPALASALLAEVAELPYEARTTATALLEEWEGDLSSLVASSSLL